MRILVTGFAPFGADTVNASWTAVSALGRRPTSGVELVCAELPVVFATAPLALDALLEQHRPDAVLAVGEAGGRRAITPEAVAHNLARALLFPDNAGARPVGAPLAPDGPATRACPVAVDPVVTALRAAGLAADRSEDAGRFVCNALAYHLYGLAVVGMFVHVPALRPSGRAGVGAETDSDPRPDPTEHDADPDPLSPDDLVTGLVVCVDVLVAHLAGRAPAPGPR